MSQLIRQQFSLAPASLQEAMHLAEMMAHSELVPKHLQKKPADCLLVIEQSIRWNLSPFAAAQETSVIQGKLMYSGKLTAAVVNALGNLAGRLSYIYEGSGENRAVIVVGRFKDEDEPREARAELKEARTQNTMWTKQPDQQLAYFGARKWARLHAPDLMLGIYSPEEIDEALISRRPPPIAPNPMQQLPAPTIHDEDGVVLEDNAPNGTTEPPPQQNGGPTNGIRLNYIIACQQYIREATDPAKLGAWWNGKEAKAGRQQYELDADEVKTLRDMVMARRDELMKETAQ